MTGTRNIPITARSGGVLIIASRHLDGHGRGVVQWWGSLLHRRAELIIDDLPPVPVPRNGWAVISGDPARGARVLVRAYYRPFNWPVTGAEVFIGPVRPEGEGKNE